MCMAAIQESPFLMFVAGVPRTGIGELDVYAGFSGRVVGFFATGLIQSGLWQQAQNVRDWEIRHDQNWVLPPGQIQVVNEVLEQTEKQQRTVTIIDVNRPSGWEETIARWVQPEDTLPVLVAPDGSRLVGMEEFSPRSVRKFVAAATSASLPRPLV